MVYGTYNELVTGAYKPTYKHGDGLGWDRDLAVSCALELLYSFGPLPVISTELTP